MPCAEYRLSVNGTCHACWLHVHRVVHLRVPKDATDMRMRLDTRRRFETPLQRGAGQLLGLQQPVRFTSWWTWEHPKSSSVKIPAIHPPKPSCFDHQPGSDLVNTPRYIDRVAITRASFIIHFYSWLWCVQFGGILKERRKIKISLIVCNYKDVKKLLGIQFD